ncbi:MAG: type VI secretion system baseplate subunit TssE [Rhabdaerophilum calidifontis]
MIRKTARERLSPPLIYAFRSAHAAGHYRKATPSPDFEPGDAPKPAPARNVLRSPITEQALRDEVARDLNALVNTISLESAVDLGEFNAVRRSILNFGIRDLNSRFADQAGDGHLVRDVAEAIRRYEPRLIASSIRVNHVVRVDEPTLTVRLEIAADLFCEPVNVPVVFIADIDVDNCDVSVSRAA